MTVEGGDPFLLLCGDAYDAYDAYEDDKRDADKLEGLCDGNGNRLTGKWGWTLRQTHG